MLVQHALYMLGAQKGCIILLSVFTAVQQLEVQRLQREVRVLRGRVRSPAEKNPTKETVSQVSVPENVFVTKYGRKYHKQRCGTIQDSDVTKYQPCGVCFEGTCAAQQTRGE